MIRQLNGTCKEMEAAAIAQVCALYDKPYVGVKSVTDLMDVEEGSSDQFLANLAFASENLQKVVINMFDNIAGLEF